MNEWGPTGLHSKVKLQDILQETRQPVSEEQAWALCYQCSCKLKQMILGDGYFPELRGTEDIYIHQDGAVSFVDSSDTKCRNVSETRVIERLGKAVYSALDWGLSSEIERVLSDPLNSLLFYMLGLNATRSSPFAERGQAVTLNYIIKECVERLFVPLEASTHYRTVCRMQHAEFKDIYKLLRTIQISKQSLRRLDSHEEQVEGIIVISDNWSTLWRNVMNELRHGVSLRSVDQRSYNALPIHYTLTPYELLMDDIRSKRYTLRPVEECDQKKPSRSEDNVILDLIRTHTLKPASERKLKERSQEEPSLHDLLMSEIKSSKNLRSTLDVHRNAVQDEEFKISSSLCSVQREYSSYSCRTGNKWSMLPVADPLDNGIYGRISWHPEFSSDSSPEHKFFDLTSSSTDLSFFPVLTSSQVDLRMNSMSSCEQTSYTHKRSNSYESSYQRSSYRQSRYTPRICLPLTISELIPKRREIVKTEMLAQALSKDFPGHKACSSCYRKRLFFTWLFSCKLCDRTICPDCNVEMLMPFKQCMHLPVSFFKVLVLSGGNDPFSQAQKKQMLYREVMHWDCSSVPLIFDPKDEAEDHSFRKRLTHNWTSMDICIKCEEFILDVLEKSHQREFPDSFWKSRSISESSAILLRH
ncbi:protein spire homolog 1-like isoform X2 [Hyla sarda]|uniref:protein spire homolog 1-like isoform X2 n=1 Tax=Hyla sarda TaxID=327740 RepID=UPI0024C3489D|nr:protein spire homolog 1-like isoform X2 [Hyla sarda]